MIEIWKDIPLYIGLYQASNLGRIKSICFSNHGKVGYIGILPQHTESCGYKQVVVWKDGKMSEKLVLQLVAQTFLPNPNNLPEVNHKDENKQNNHVNNLEWCTHQYNIRYSQSKSVGCYKNGLLIKQYPALSDVKNDGFLPSKVCECCKGNRPHHKGFTWKYLDINLNKISENKNL